MVINSIFFRSSKRAVGGSSSASMGAIWMNHSPKLENGDIVELLVHELAHHMMFIDERCYLHYYYEEIIKEENYAVLWLVQSFCWLEKHF